MVMPNFSYKFYNTTSNALEAMRESILAAQTSIYWEIYSLIDDSVGGPFLDILCEKARAGLEVKIVVDWIGSFEMSRAGFNRLRSAGVDLVIYNPLFRGWSLRGWIRSFWYRNHRKVLVVDREVVFLGGVNVAQMYSAWDDLHVRLTGRVVSPLLHAFARAYVRGGGDNNRVKHLLHAPFKKEWQDFKTRCKFILSSPLENKKTPTRKIFLNSLAKAKTRFSILTPYFVPDINFFKLVKEAKARGVIVELFLPMEQDKKYLEWVLGLYSRLAHINGIDVYLSKKMHHGKAMMADDNVGFIGSVNFTHRSFFINDEAGIVFHDMTMIMDLNNIFADLRQTSTKLTELTYLQLGWTGKIKDWLGKRFGGLI